VRRGDVRHDNDHHFRYLPNAHYLRTLRAIFRALLRLDQDLTIGSQDIATLNSYERSYNANSAAHSIPCSKVTHVSIHVFSESLSDESFEPFLDLGNMDSACDDNTSVAVDVCRFIWILHKRMHGQPSRIPTFSLC